jgi:hypothetical protein
MNKSYAYLIIKKPTKILLSVLLLCSLFTCQTEDAGMPIELEAKIDPVTEFGESVGSIDLTATGGREPFTFFSGSPVKLCAQRKLVFIGNDRHSGLPVF